MRFLLFVIKLQQCWIGCKDNCKGRSDEHTCPFFGNINWESVIQALSEIGNDGCISLETHISDKMLSVVKEQMQTCLAKIARDFADRIAEK